LRYAPRRLPKSVCSCTGRLAGRRPASCPGSRDAAAARDIGQIAILEDGDGVVDRLNLFDLDRRVIVFSPAAAGYRFRAQEAGYDAQAPRRESNRAGRRRFQAADAAVRLPLLRRLLPADLRQLRRQSHLHRRRQRFERSLTRTSDGRAPSHRGAVSRPGPLACHRGRARASRAGPRGGELEPGAGISRGWNGTAPDFQIRLYRMDASRSPLTACRRATRWWASAGRLQGTASVVSFADGSSDEYASTIAERFSSNIEIDVVTAAQKFYETHEDAYDYLCSSTTWASKPRTRRGLRADRAHQPAGNRRQGSELRGEYGSAGRLQSVLNMGPLSQYPADRTRSSRAAVSRATPP